MNNNLTEINECKRGEALEVIEGQLPGDRAYRRCRKRRLSMKRTLDPLGLFSIAYANVGSTVYFTLGVVAFYALGATPLVVLLAAVFFLFTAMAYAEGAAAIPEAGGSSSFARKGFNELVSFISAWCLLLGYIAVTAIASFSAICYLGSFQSLEILHEPTWTALTTGFLLFILMIVNIIGTKESSTFSSLLAAADVITQVFIVLVGSLFFLNVPKLLSAIHWGTAPTWAGLASSAYLVMISFSGIETVSNLAEESKSPEKTIPRSMWLSVGIIIFLYLGLSNVAMGAMPVSYQVKGYVYSIDQSAPGPTVEEGKQSLLFYYRTDTGKKTGFPVKDAHVILDNQYVRTDDKGFFRITGIGMGPKKLIIRKTGYNFEPILFDTSKGGDDDKIEGSWVSEFPEKWINAPLAGIVSKLPVFRETLGGWVSILAFIVLAIAANAGMMGLAKTITSMGAYRQIPSFLAAPHPHTGTPMFAIVIFTVAAFLLILSGRIEKMAEVYAFAATISYTIAHLSIIALRIRFPEMKRPYTIPLGITIAGREIPITSVIGALVCFSLWVIVAVKQEFGRNVGIPFLLLGVLMYMIYRFGQKLSFTQTINPQERM
jgi:amino acid transporter